METTANPTVPSRQAVSELSEASSAFPANWTAQAEASDWGLGSASKRWPVRAEQRLRVVEVSENPILPVMPSAGKK